MCGFFWPSLKALRRTLGFQCFPQPFSSSLDHKMVNKWEVGRHDAAHSPGGCYSIMVLNQALSSWTLFWLGLGYSFLWAAQWWSLIKHGTVLWNLQGMFEGRKEQKKEKRQWGRLAKWEILVETEAGEALQNKKVHVFLLQYNVFVCVCMWKVELFICGQLQVKWNWRFISQHVKTEDCSRKNSLRSHAFCLHSE